ncbi:phospholipase-like protein [Tanacetum coccineum]
MQRHLLSRSSLLAQVEVNDVAHQRYSLEQITNTQNTGPSDVDHLDKNGNRFENVPVDHRSMEGASQCKNVDHVNKNSNDVFENFPIDCLDHQSVEGVSQCMSVDHVDKMWNDESESVAINGLLSFRSQDTNHISKDNEESSHFDSFLSTQKNFSLYDVGVPDSMDVDQPSLVNNVLGDVHVDSVVKDGNEIDVKTVVVPFQREKKLSKACLSPYVVPPPTTEVKCKKRRRNNNKKKSKIVIKSVFGPDGNEILLLPWKEANDDLAMASPYLSDMLIQCEFPVYYADGVKYGVPWFANSVEKVYFLVNEKDFHWCLEELHIRSGVVTFYDSLGGLVME